MAVALGHNMDNCHSLWVSSITIDDSLLLLQNLAVLHETILVPTYAWPAGLGHRWARPNFAAFIPRTVP